MNTLQKIYRKDRHITRLLIMMVVWMVFMAITKFDKFYAIANFQTIAGRAAVVVQVNIADQSVSHLHADLCNVICFLYM